ncbi:hypothetical protein FQR65_LT11767 [Abscondita terminalis]|nr:hypothetical protein FQR65_LT11767 [Abscondita terminalis]
MQQYQNGLVVLDADVLFNVVRKQWVQIEDIVLEDVCLSNVDCCDLRVSINQTLSLCRTSLQGHLIDKQVNVASPSVRDERQPVSVYYHLYLEMQWHILCLQYFNASSSSYADVLKDLIALSYVLFKKAGNLVKETVFMCTCIKRFWLLLQRFAETDFWFTFNGALKTYDDVFKLWLLYHVSHLQGYDSDGNYIGSHSTYIKENFELIEVALKSINTKCVQPSKDENFLLLQCCSLIYPVLNDLWIKCPKSEPYQILWEIFNKHLNVSLDVEQSVDSAQDLMESINQVSATTKNAFHYFLYMLKQHLTKYPNQWAKIKGRIYSKLSSNKVRELTKVGIYNVGLLFLSLARCVNIAEVTDKLFALLDLTRDIRFNPLVLHIYMCLIVLHAQLGLCVDSVSAPLVKVVCEVVEQRDKYNLIRSFIEGFDLLLNTSKNYYLKQHTMLGSWVSKYIACCSFSDLCYFLNILLSNVKSLRKECAWSEWEPVLKQHVLPGLKDVATITNCPSQVGTLTALIDRNPASEFVLIFTSDPINVNVTCQFITTLLEDVSEGFFGLPRNHETAVLHAWVRCCLLNCDSIDKLSNNVAKITVLSELFNKDSADTNPLCAFVKGLNRTRSDLINCRELCEQCFGQLHSWVIPHITTPTSEACALHMYTCISLIFYQNWALFFSFAPLVNIFLLPTDILMGKAPHAHVLSAVQRTWHLFMYGIYVLDGSSDAYIERTLRDMVARYVPLLSTNNSPMLKCSKNERLSTFILERISTSFLLHSSRSSEVNTTKALRIIQLAFETTSNIRIILKCTLSGIFEVILFQNNKTLAIDLVKYVASCEKDEAFKQYVKSAFMITTEKHLAFHTNNYFQFVGVLAKIMPSDVREFLPIVKKQVVEVEQMRGVGYDNVLRQGLNRLETLLS